MHVKGIKPVFHVPQNNPRGQGCRDGSDRNVGRLRRRFGIRDTAAR
jgi:hypothetical protein